MNISGVDVASGVIDLEFRVTVLEKLLQRLLQNPVVSAGLTQRDIQMLWDHTFAEVQSRYPNFRLEMTPPFTLEIKPSPQVGRSPAAEALSPFARELLLAAVADKHGTVMRFRTMGGMGIQTNDRQF